MPVVLLLLLLLGVALPAQDITYRGHHAQAVMDTYIGGAALKGDAEEVRNLVYVGLIAGEYHLCNIIIDGSSVGWYELNDQGICQKIAPRAVKAEWKTTDFTSAATGKSLSIRWGLVDSTP